jgi:hypothetical protein
MAKEKRVAGGHWRWSGAQFSRELPAVSHTPEVQEVQEVRPIIRPQ